MRKWLGNPWAVAGLFLVAAAIAIVNVGGLESMPDEGIDMFKESLNLSSTPKEIRKSFEPENARWSSVIDNDPFRDQASGNKTRSTKNHKRRTALPRLSALVAGPDTRYAVLNGKIVKEGGRVGKFAVQSIEPDRVHLIGPEGPVRLFFKGS